MVDMNGYGEGWILELRSGDASYFFTVTSILLSIE